MTVLLCQLLTHGGELSSRFTRLVGMREHLSDQCREQKRTIKRQDDKLAEQATRANEKITKLTSELATLKGAYKEAEDSYRERGEKNKELKEKNAELKAKNVELKAEVRDLKRKFEKDIKKIRTGVTSFFRDDFEKLVWRFLESDEFSQAFAGVINLGVSRGVKRGLRMGRTETQFQDISRRISHFVPGAKKKLDDAMTAFPTQAFPFFDKVVQSALRVICETLLSLSLTRWFLPARRLLRWLLHQVI